MRFAVDSQVLLDWTHDTNAVLDALDKLATEKPKSRTALYDACYHAVEMTQKGGRSKRVIILFSDGVDLESSGESKKRLQRALRESDVMVYAVNVIGRQGAIPQIKVSVKLPPDAPRALRNLSASHREGYYAVSNQR